MILDLRKKAKCTNYPIQNNLRIHDRILRTNWLVAPWLQAIYCNSQVLYHNIKALSMVEVPVFHAPGLRKIVSHSRMAYILPVLFAPELT